MVPGVTKFPLAEIMETPPPELSSKECPITNCPPPQDSESHHTASSEIPSELSNVVSQLDVE